MHEYIVISVGTIERLINKRIKDSVTVAFL